VVPNHHWNALAALLTAVFLVLLPGKVSAHDIPNDVAIHAFLKPEANRLYLLVRVPMRALRDVEFPKRGSGFLDIAKADSATRDAATLWVAGSFEVYENDARLPNPAITAIRVSLPSDRSFESYEQAAGHLKSEPLSESTELVWDQGVLDVALEYPIQSDQSQFSIRPLVARLGLRVLTVLRFLPPNSDVRPFEFGGDPGLIHLDPRWHQAALRFVKLGFTHILDGVDHLLFLLLLVIPFRNFRSLVLIVTSFTVAHSVALFAAAYRLVPDSLWFPPLVEALIAISIVYMAVENIVGSNLQRRWLIAFGFGLVHGFGFSFVLHETFQFAGSHLFTSLASFNVGAELGQILVIALLVPALGLLFRYVAERIGTIILSAFVAHTGWHWTIDRVDRLRQFQFQPWVMDAATAASLLRWLMVVVAFVALGWAAALLQRRFLPASRKWKI
jgi:hypothetical protein